MNKFISIFLLLTCSLPPLCAQPKPSRGLVQALKKAPSAAAAARPANTALKALQTSAASSAKTAAGLANLPKRHPLPFEPDYIPETLFDPNDVEFRISPQAVILDKYDDLFKRFEYNFKSEETLSREKAAYAKQARQALTAPLPAPTAPYELIHVYHLPEAMLPQYRRLQADIEIFHPYLCNKLLPFLGASAPQWNPAEKRTLDSELMELSNKINKLMKHMQNLDPLLSRTLTNINWAREILFDMPGQLVVTNIPRPKPFNLNEYRLISPLDASPRLAIHNDDYFFSSEKARQAAAQFCEQIPAGLRIAVLNDNPAHIGQYVSWQNDGIFSNGITVETFVSIGDFIQSHYENPFSLILTDYFIPGGGGDFLVKILRNRRDATPVILQSYAGQNTSAWDMTRSASSLEKDYYKGYDGELPGNDDFFSSRGYLYVLEGIRNFYLLHQAEKAH